MAADNHWSGRVTITPPLTWQECKVSPGVEDVKLDIREEDGPDGRILTAVAVVPARSSNSWSAHTGQELQFLIDSHPRHEFAGELRCDWAPVYGDEAVLAERWTVDGRTVVHEEGRLTWQRRGGAPDSHDRWRDAFESLHARLLRDLPGDASELPPPDDEYWARQLDELLTFAAQLAHETETGAGTVPADTDKTGD